MPSRFAARPPVSVAIGVAAIVLATANLSAEAQGNCATVVIEGQIFTRCGEPAAAPMGAPSPIAAPPSPSPPPMSGAPRSFQDPRNDRTCRPVEISGLIFSICE